MIRLLSRFIPFLFPARITSLFRFLTSFCLSVLFVDSLFISLFHRFNSRLICYSRFFLFLFWINGFPIRFRVSFPAAEPDFTILCNPIQKHLSVFLILPVKKPLYVNSSPEIENGFQAIYANGPYLLFTRFSFLFLRRLISFFSLFLTAVLYIKKLDLSRRFFKIFSDSFRFIFKLLQ